MRAPPHLFLRTYVSPAAARKPRPASKLGPTVSLDHFLQRSLAISLYRRILRDCKRIPDVQSREETKRFVREDFERNRKCEDLVSYAVPVAYLI